MIKKNSETMKMNIDRQQWGQTILQAENDEQELCFWVLELDWLVSPSAAIGECTAGHCRTRLSHTRCWTKTSQPQNAAPVLSIHSQSR